MDLKTRQWDAGMCKFFGIDMACLPAIKSSAQVYGHVKDGPMQGVPIAGILGDQQAALLGQTCLTPGSLKNTYGTGCFMLCNTGANPVTSSRGLLTTVAYQLGPKADVVYALEGSIAICGAVATWLRDNLGIIKDVNEIGHLASKVPDSGGVYFVPAFSGLFAPYWRQDARGSIFGLTQHSNRNHICRAALDAIAYQTRDIIDAMEDDLGYKVDTIAVDGGLSNSDVAMQIQADLTQVRISRPAMRESTALGAALAAGHAVGAIDIQEFQQHQDRDAFAPLQPPDAIDAQRIKWTKAIEASCDWV